MRFLRLSSALLLALVASCSAPYSHLQEVKNSEHSRNSAMRFKPVFQKELYRCVVDGHILFKKFHLSGLLFFKTFDDGSTRAVFQNEMGFTFFDFKWDKADSFSVVSIIPQLDKPALVKTLKKDFNLLLMKNLDKKSELVFEDRRTTMIPPPMPQWLTGPVYYRFTLEKGYAYYIAEDGQLGEIENSGKSKIISINFTGKRPANDLPQAIFFKHHKAHFTIDLKKITPDAE